jgi:hypothetical protein
LVLDLTRLFVTQRDHRLNARRPPCRKAAGKGRNHHQHKHGNAKDEGAVCFNAIEFRLGKVPCHPLR